MNIHLETYIEVLEEELHAIKAINQKLQLDNKELKEQFSLQGVMQCSCPKESTDFYDEYGNLLGWGCLECGIIGQ